MLTPNSTLTVFTAVNMRKRNVGRP